MVERFEVHLVNLDPRIGSEIQKTRPCLIISPDEMNRHLRTAIIAPMTTSGRGVPSRVRCRFQSREGWIVLDQIRTVDKLRLLRRLGRLSETRAREVAGMLTQMFSHGRR